MLAEASDRLQEMRNWLSSSSQTDAFIGPVRIAIDPEDPSSRSLQATNNIPAQTSILRIPPTHVITSQKVKQQSFVREILGKATEDSLDARLPDTTTDSAAIILFLLAELSKNDSSFWYPWFQSLPKAFFTPLTESSESRLMELLFGSPALALVKGLREEMREMYDDWFIPYAQIKFPEIFLANFCTFERFMYAHAILESRAFKIDDLTVLAPFADMANHACGGSRVCNTRVRGWVIEGSVDGLGLEFLTKDQPVDNGEEVCISYGQLANWELLVHFGFSLRDNLDDGVVIELEADDKDPMDVAMSKMIILFTACGRERLNFKLTASDALPQELLICARVLLLEGDELSNGSRRDFSKCISVRNERAVVNWLREIFQRLLDDCDMSDDDDNVDQHREEQEAYRRFRNHCRVYVQSLRQVYCSGLAKLDELERSICGDQDNTG